MAVRLFAVFFILLTVLACQIFSPISIINEVISPDLRLMALPHRHDLIVAIGDDTRHLRGLG
jgi:hypothetical protein